MLNANQTFHDPKTSTTKETKTGLCMKTSQFTVYLPFKDMEKNFNTGRGMKCKIRNTCQNTTDELFLQCLEHTNSYIAQDMRMTVCSMILQTITIQTYHSCLL